MMRYPDVLPSRKITYLRTRILELAVGNSLIPNLIIDPILVANLRGTAPS
jgi:hypothetical protein